MSNSIQPISTEKIDTISVGMDNSFSETENLGDKALLALQNLGEVEQANKTGLQNALARLSTNSGDAASLIEVHHHINNNSKQSNIISAFMGRGTKTLETLLKSQ